MATRSSWFLAGPLELVSTRRTRLRRSRAPERSTPGCSGKLLREWSTRPPFDEIDRHKLARNKITGKGKLKEATRPRHCSNLCFGHLSTAPESPVSDRIASVGSFGASLNGKLWHLMLCCFDKRQHSTLVVLCWLNVLNAI